MNKAIQIDTCYIGSHFASPLVNGDTSGLEANEEHQLEDWYGGFQTQLEDGYHLHFDVKEFGFLCKCEVTGLLSDCCLVEVYEIRSTK